jgi:hypothetical protein
LRKLRKRQAGIAAEELVKGDPKSKKMALDVEETEETIKLERLDLSLSTPKKEMHRVNKSI